MRFERHHLSVRQVTSLSVIYTPGRSVVRLTSGTDRLTFAGDAVFPPAFDHPDWQNGFEHDPEESTRVRVRLLQEAVETGELLVATHLPFPSIGRVAADRETFRWVAVYWGY
jgi:glyoxylase-like metal-dependent hydrolase (beta-lactamase superfamily II)